MENKNFGKELEIRTKKFAINVTKLSSSLSNTIELRVIKNQLVKSGTSIGANYREANKSRSKADFQNRIKICQSETNETLYWLEIVEDVCRQNKPILIELISESKELLALFTAIVNKLKSQNKTIS